jgi:Ca2+-binding RTX toxin-like protein
MAEIFTAPETALRMDQIRFADLFQGAITNASSTSVTYDLGNGYITQVVGTDLNPALSLGGPVSLVEQSLNGRVILTLHFDPGNNSSLTNLLFFAGREETLSDVSFGEVRITGSNTNDYLSAFDGNDYIFGGAGADTILGNAGNDHLYGQSAVAGPDDADLIMGGAGSDYIQGDAGADELHGDSGGDRIFGGADNDVIYGDAGNDTVNGNRGDDRIYGGINEDSVRGGQGNDRIFGESGNDILLGDLGNDTLEGGAGLDLMTGSAGHDMFTFRYGDAFFFKNAPSAYATDVITDFTPSSMLSATDDGIFVGYVPSAVLVATAATAAAAYDAAQALLAATPALKEFAAVQVGTDAYLFWNAIGDADTVDSAVKLLNVNASALGQGDFQG